MKTLLVRLIQSIRSAIGFGETNTQVGAEAPSTARKDSWFNVDTSKSLQRKIMRGIYYAYMLRLLSLPGVLQGFIMLGVLILLTRFVSLGHVIQNLSHIELSHIGTFVYNGVRTTEVWTLLLIGILVFLSLSLRISFIPRKTEQYAYAQV